MNFFDKKVAVWEWKWVNSHTAYTKDPLGDPVMISKAIYNKYASRLNQDFHQEN